jgi:hypothetical protein
MADYYYRHDEDYSSDEELSAAIERSLLTYNTVPELAQLPPIDSAEAFPVLPNAVPRAQASSSGSSSLPQWSARGHSALRQAPVVPVLPQSKAARPAKTAKASAAAAASTQFAAAPKAAVIREDSASLGSKAAVIEAVDVSLSTVRRPRLVQLQQL